MVAVDSVDVGRSDQFEESDLASTAHDAIAHGDDLRHRNIDRADPIDRRKASDRLSGLEQHSPIVPGGFPDRPRLPLVGLSVEIELIGEPRTSLFGCEPSERRKTGESCEPPTFEAFTVEDRGSGAQDETVDPFRVAPPQQLGDRAAHRVADGDESVDSQSIGDEHGVVGAVFQSKPLLRSKTGAVTSMVECHHVIALGECFVAFEPIQVGGCCPSVEQDDDWAADSTERTHGNGAEITDIDELAEW